MVDPGFFVNRLGELELLEGAWRAGRPGLVAVYGRRRVGKTRLLLEWARGKRVAYYQAGLWSHTQNLEGLASALAEQLELEELASLQPRDLRGLLRLAARLLAGERAGIVIDEFTYWVRVAEAVVADLQWFVDHVLPQTRILLVVSGSLVGLMERGVLGGGAPLYGRATLRVRLGELSPWCIAFFAPRYTPEQLVELYSLVGGVPYYLRQVDDGRPPLEAWLQLFGPQGSLQDEPLFLLRDEFRDPHPYLALARGLAAGPTTLGKAASIAGMPTSHASKYLHVLLDLGIASEIPLLPRRRRGRLYRLADRLLRSWLYLYDATLSYAGKPGGRLVERFSRLVAEGWEELAALHAAERLRAEGVAVDEAGKLLHRGVEVDWILVSHSQKLIVAVEAKWSKLTPSEAEEVRRSVLGKLRQALPRELTGYQAEVLIYARECRGCPDNVVTPEDMPWRRGCPTRSAGGGVG